MSKRYVRMVARCIKIPSLSMSTNPPRDGILVRNLLINSNCRKKLIFRFPIVASLSMKAIKKNFFSDQWSIETKTEKFELQRKLISRFCFPIVASLSRKISSKIFFLPMDVISSKRKPRVQICRKDRSFVFCPFIDENKFGTKKSLFFSTHRSLKSSRG